MKVTRHQKLVRDNIPDIIQAQGVTAITRILSVEEYRAALLDKLVEEVNEYRENPSAAEIADIQEVLLALMAELGLTPKAVEQVRTRKATKNGAFTKRIFLEETRE